MVTTACLGYLGGVTESSPVKGMEWGKFNGIFLVKVPPSYSSSFIIFWRKSRNQLIFVLILANVPALNFF